MNMKKLLLIFLMFVSSPIWAQNEVLRLRAVHLYQDDLALLEYRGEVGGIRFDLPLPEGSLPEGIIVRTGSNDRLLQYMVQDITTEVKKPILSYIEMLRENVGFSVTLEVFEGRESVSYTGEVQGLDEKSQIVFLRTNSSLEVIPIGNIQHLSGGRGLNIATRRSQTSRVLTILFVGEVSNEPLTILIPNTSIKADAGYLLDFDRAKTELSLDLRLKSALSADDISLFYYGVPFNQQKANTYAAQAAFQLSGVRMQAGQQAAWQILSTPVDLTLVDEAEISPWLPDATGLTQSTRASRSLIIQNNSPISWFSAAIHERKSKSIGKIPGMLPTTVKGGTARIEYGKSPYVINDNARLVKVSKKAITLNGMKFDSYLFEGKLDIRNTGTEAGRIKVIKQAVPENYRNYWFANVFLDLKGKSKQEVTQFEFEVKVEANDATFYRYRYELLVPSAN
jgi:hypothetical protein